MKRRNQTMLEKSIRMNLEIPVKYASTAIGWVTFGCLMLGLLTFPALAVTVVCIFLGFRELFDKSLFGEEAYAYMTVPISMRCMIIGKVIAACFWLTLGFMLAYIALGVAGLIFRDYYLDWSVGAVFLQENSGVFEAVENGIIGKDEIIYDRVGLMQVAANIVLAPLMSLADSIFVCALFQLGYTVRHVLAPRRDKPLVTVMVAAAGGVAFCLVLAACVGLGILFFENFVTIGAAILEIVIFGGCGIALLAVAIRLLERKYSLC